MIIERSVCLHHCSKSIVQKVGNNINYLCARLLLIYTVYLLYLYVLARARTYTFMCRGADNLQNTCCVARRTHHSALVQQQLGPLGDDVLIKMSKCQKFSLV